MAALNFPDAPSDGDTYTPVGSNITYTYSSAKGSWKGNVGSSAATNTLTSTIVATNTTAATHYPVFVNSATGNEEMRTDTGLTYNPSTGVLTATSFSGAIAGMAITALNNATANELVTVGSTTTELDAESNLTFDASTNQLESGGTGAADSLGPLIKTYRNSSSPADWDYMGAIAVYGETDTDAKISYMSIRSRIMDATNASAQGQLEIWNATSGAEVQTFVFKPDLFQLSTEQPIEWKDHKGTAYECRLDWITPTAGRTVNLPDADGTVALIGKQSIWIPAASMYPATTNGCAALAQVELGNGPELKCLDFDTSSDEFAQFTIAMPKAYNGGTVSYRAYFTVTGTNTGTVGWKLRGISLSDNHDLNTSFGASVGPNLKAHSGTSNDLNITDESGGVLIADGAGGSSPAVDDLILFELWRDVSSDNQTGDARLLGIKMFFTTDKANDG